MILFRSDEERQAFKEDLERNPVTAERQHDTVFAQNDPMISEQDRKIIAFSNAVIERFSEWKGREALLECAPPHKHPGHDGGDGGAGEHRPDSPLDQ